MDGNGLVSVIVPVYNTGPYLPRCIESIIRQNYEKIELLLIDDGSTDNSLEICRKYMQIDNRIKVILKKMAVFVWLETESTRNARRLFYVR